MVELTGSKKVKTAVFISGTGSNLKSLIKFSKLKKSPISINLFMGERGLISYYEKKSLLNDLNEEKNLLTKNITDIERKNNLLSGKLDFDFVDTLIRQSFKFGNKEDILININD